MRLQPDLLHLKKEAVRHRFVVGVALIATAGVLVVAGAGGAAAKGGAKATKVRCTATTYNQSYPNLSGFSFSVLKCSMPFGAGVQQATYNESVVGTTSTASGTFKDFHDLGTVHGTYTLSGTLGTGAITASGLLKISGGTGAFKGAKGTAKLTCTTTDGGKTYTCTSTGTGTL